MQSRAARRSARSANDRFPHGRRVRASAHIARTIALFFLAACGGGGSSTTPTPPRPTPTATAPSTLLRISEDAFQNASSQHATEVEPDVAASGSTVVATFQVGRFFQAGASGIGYATSHDGGAHFSQGILPGLTRVQDSANAYDTASDPAIAYDAAHDVWLIATLPVSLSGKPVPAALVSRSRDGERWTLPVLVDPGRDSTDKEWIACDDAAASPFYGRCYVVWDDPSTAAQGQIYVSTSADGGATWGPPVAPKGHARGIGARPVVQPNGNIVVVMNDDTQQHILALLSSDGGATFSAPIAVSNVVDHEVAADLRTSPLPTADVDATGTIYVVWQDCRFRPACAGNDLVMSTSSDGRRWKRPIRIPIDARTSTVDHFIPGLSVRQATAGGGAQLALAYYFYPETGCDASTCALAVGYVSSPDGGASWSPSATLAGPMAIAALPATLDGFMVGDYIATTFAGSTALATFAVALPKQGTRFDEAMYVPLRLPEARTRFGFRQAIEEQPVPGAASDHPPHPPGPLGR
jgi:BNR repeat protein